MIKNFYPIISLAIATLSLSTIFENSTIFAHEIPKAECISNSFGNIKCGYNCVRNSFGNMRCSDWPGGACKANSFGNIVCGPPAPPDWLSNYTNNSNSTRSAIYGAWAVQNGRWNGILRMQGNSGRMILTTNTGASVEQKMTIRVNPEGGYILDGEVLSRYIREEYYADNFYIQQFSRDSISIKNCDDRGNCNSATLVYLGK